MSARNLVHYLAMRKHDLQGPYILDAVRALDNILRRMQTHQRKKSAMLRELRLADRFLNGSRGWMPSQRAGLRSLRATLTLCTVFGESSDT